MFFRFQAVNDLVTELEQANITCAATITFAENDYKEQLQTLKVKNTLELVQFFPTALFIYFFFLYMYLSAVIHDFLSRSVYPPCSILSLRNKYGYRVYVFRFQRFLSTRERFGKKRINCDRVAREKLVSSRK